MAKIQDGKKRILCVEDHRDTAELVAALLCDHEVVVAGNKAEGLRRTTDERFDLYIFDYDLPDGTGIDLCLFVRTNDEVTPIVLCTASPVLTEQEAIAAGVQRFIKKGDDFIQSLEAAASQFLSVPGYERDRFLFMDDFTGWDASPTLNAEAGVRAAEISYRGLFEIAQDGILVLDAQTRQIIEANPFFCQLLQYSRRELIGKELW